MKAIAPAVGRVVLVAAVALFFVLAWFLVARPAGQWADGRQDAAAAQADLEGAEATNADLRARLAALTTDREIERIARAEYGLVYPDEEAYAVLPPPERDLEFFHRWPY
ncbi:MAG: septum formation initiator family protein [Acidimicrobiales bacterium]|nr:septum formation initiator family protein [Acidimicrobiales bacterium]